MNKRKTMQKLAQKYIEHRHKLGFAIKIEGMQLLKFAAYADRCGHKGPLTTDLALSWARLPKEAAPLYQARRLEIVRCFAKYLAIFDQDTQIPPNGLLGKAHKRSQPYIYSEEEIIAIVEAAGALTPIRGLRPKTYSTLFGLLASTGMRISEALKLQRNDVDLDLGVLKVVDSKFHKSRLVALHPSTNEVLKEYVIAREHHHPCPKSNAFLLSEHGDALKYFTVRHTFRLICRRLGLKSIGKRKLPRIYDIRHTFACRRLLQWYRNDVDVEHGIAALSTYMGHVKVSDTYWYLTGVPELMQIATQRFEHFVQNNK